jgi:glucuronate isomerase
MSTMKKFLDEHFLLSNTTAKRLYHDYAKDMPVIDYHCHLPPAQIAADASFGNLTQAWLYGDHYKWRAMRTNGVPESYCTGNRTDLEKFEKWAETVPYTLRNPLYHWTHLELQRYFDIHDILSPATAADIYYNASAQLGTSAYSTRNLLRKMNVALVCTTDDPADTLEYHQQIRQDGFEIPILPAFRPDQSMNVDDPEKYNQYLQRLEEASGITITTYADLLDALKNRHDFFASQGCTVSDHGIEEIYAEDFHEKDIDAIFLKVRSGNRLSLLEARQIKSALLLQLAEWDWEKGWVQQYHLGALRNNNSRMMRLLGPDTGWDSIGDFSQARALAKFLDRLDSQDKLARTIIYNLNPADNELLATMIGNFNDGSIAGKVQFGSAWWFLDQKDGMIKQLNALSNMGLLSRFVGMLTDSRSFLSYPRHEYFRRIVCELLGQEVENGELPNDIEWIGKVVKDICYYNAQQYFNWKELGVEAGVSR